MKHFLVILGLTALVWLGVSMSEVHEYPMHIHIEMTGYDTLRYAVVHADTLLPVQAEMSGFNAAAIDLLHIKGHVSIEMPAEGLVRSVAFADVGDNLRQQLAPIGVRRLSSSRDSLRMVLAERGRRECRVVLDSARFSFRQQYGLYGEPMISPSTVTLFGPDSVINAVGCLHVLPVAIDDISATSTYRLELDPVWERLGDVRASHTEVEVYLPVEPYVEREYHSPIEVDGADSTVRLRLYPDMARVRVWIAQRDLDRVPEFRVAISYDDVLAGNGRLTPRLVQFPSWVRPRSVEPAEVQCVIIK